MEISISDLMTRELVIFPSNARTMDVARELLDKNISSVLIRDETGIKGIVTERDFLKAAAFDELPATVKDMMNFPLITIEGSKSPLEAAKVMGEHHIRHLVVEEEGEVVGIISLRDILKAFPETIYGYVSRMQDPTTER
jgi:signal-transduction protein with cAMP-binding, CBS, and nucleotidyltransferase domain